jgi:phosphatidylinositol dimannoside acyltransferase
VTVLAGAARLRERVLDAGYAAGWALVKALPHRVAAAGFRLGADVAVRRQGPGVRRLRANLRRVAGPDASDAEIDALTRRALRSYARYWLEVFRLPVLGTDRILAGTRVEHGERLDDALAAGRGVVCALPHCGNWDAAAMWIIGRGVTFTTVAERLQPESLYRRFLAYREGLGMEVVPLTGGDRPPSEVLAERLRAGGLVCLLGDRDLTRGGVDVTFFGEPTRMPAGPALLAATTGAALLPVGLWFDGDGWGLRIHAAVPLASGAGLRAQVRAATQALADAFAADIAARPEDWHMLQRLWLADLPAGRAARPAAAPDLAAPAPVAQTPIAQAPVARAPVARPPADGGVAPAGPEG